MPQKSLPDISENGMRELGLLVRQESYSLGGQVEKLKLIERLLMAANPDFNPIRLPAEDGLYSLILRVGEPDAPFKVFLPSHVDTVEPLPEWYDAHRLLPDGIDPDKLRGLGVGDMLAACWINMELARTIRVPEGAEYIFGWIPDEEKKSRGARSVVKNLRDWDKVSLVLGSEIGSFRSPPNDEGQRVVVGRRGVIKFDATITVGEGGHADEAYSPNAIQAYRNAVTDLERQFSGDVHSLKLAREHPMIGKERFQDWRVRSDSPEGALNPTMVEFGYRIHLVPPSTLPGVLEQQRACFRRIAEQGNWVRWRINWELIQNATHISYQPYAVPDDHPLLEAIVQGAAKAAEAWARPGIDTTPKKIAGPWSDENIYAGEGDLQKIVIGLPYEMQNPHTPREHASRRSIARALEVQRFLLEEYFQSIGVISQYRKN